MKQIRADRYGNDSRKKGLECVWGLGCGGVCVCVLRRGGDSLSHRPPEGRHHCWDPRTKDLSGVCPFFFRFLWILLPLPGCIFPFLLKQLLFSLDSSLFYLFLATFGCLVGTKLLNMPCVQSHGFSSLSIDNLICSVRHLGPPSQTLQQSCHFPPAEFVLLLRKV